MKHTKIFHLQVKKTRDGEFWRAVWSHSSWGSSASSPAPSVGHQLGLHHLGQGRGASPAQSFGYFLIQVLQGGRWPGSWAELTQKTVRASIWPFQEGADCLKHLRRHGSNCPTTADELGGGPALSCVVLETPSQQPPRPPPARAGGVQDQGHGGSRASPRAV